MPDTESAACAAVSESDSCNEGEFRLMLGRKLKELRKRKLLTITQLSLYTGLSVGYLSNVERGQTSPTVDNLRKICDELDVSPAELITQKIEGKSIIRSTDAQIIVRPESGMTITQYDFGAIAEPYSVIRLEAGDFPRPCTRSPRCATCSPASSPCVSRERSSSSSPATPCSSARTSAT